jgi:hypothetical protein
MYFRRSGLRCADGSICDSGSGGYLVPEFQQFPMQRIDLLGVQCGQILQLVTKFILLPSTQPDGGHREHDANCRLGQG